MTELGSWESYCVCSGRPASVVGRSFSSGTSTAPTRPTRPTMARQWPSERKQPGACPARTPADLLGRRAMTHQSSQVLAHAPLCRLEQQPSPTPYRLRHLSPPGVRPQSGTGCEINKSSLSWHHSRYRSVLNVLCARAQFSTI